MCLAIPGLIEKIENETDPVYRTGWVNFSGIVKQINLAYVPRAKVGEYVIVHAGFAISQLNESLANRTLNDLKQLSESVRD